MKTVDRRQPSTTGPYLAAGISVVAINYRHISMRRPTRVVPPVLKGAMDDRRRDLQFVAQRLRSWNIEQAAHRRERQLGGACRVLYGSRLSRHGRSEER